MFVPRDRVTSQALITMAAFHIESMNQNDTILGTSPPQESYRLAAPSRPPSRNSNRSPLGQMVNWTVPGPQGVQFSSRSSFWITC
jgi:hypothetical protein